MEQLSADPASSERLFWPRSSEAARNLINALSLPPSSPLAPEEQKEIVDFETALFEGRYEHLTANGLQTLPSRENTSFQLVPEYFTLSEAEGALNRLAGTSKSVVGSDTASIMNTLRSIPFTILDTKLNDLRDLKGDSLDYAKQQYATAAAGDSIASDIPTIELLRKPEILLEYLGGLLEYRQFLSQVRQHIRMQGSVSPSTLLDAKYMVTTMYRDKLSAQFAQSFTSFQSFLAQYDLQSDAERDQLKTLMSKVEPLERLARKAMDNEKLQTRCVRWFDYVRNGASIDKEGNLTPIDQQVYDDAVFVNDHLDLHIPVEQIFTDDEITQLGTIFFEADDMVAFLNAYMTEIGLEGWYAEKRTETKSLSVSSIQKLVLVPATYKRSITQTSPAVGPVAITEHEVGGSEPGHVMQSVNANLNTNAFALGKNPKFRGKRHASTREAGSIFAEAEAMGRYFGQRRPVNIAYAKAFEVLLQGGVISQAVIAFSQEHFDIQPDLNAEQRKAVYDLAADRVMRLTQFGGRNSQPLEYVEAAALRRIFMEHGAGIGRVILAEGIFDPVDLMRLHQFGLLSTDTNHTFKPKRDPTEVMTELLRAKLTQFSSKDVIITT